MLVSVAGGDADLTHGGTQDAGYCCYVRHGSRIWNVLEVACPHAMLHATPNKGSKQAGMHAASVAVNCHVTGQHGSDARLMTSHL